MLIESVNVGNLFIGRNDDICAVINIHSEDIPFVDIRNKQGVVYRESFDNLRPIQLNEEWLFKCGYVKEEHLTTSIIGGNSNDSKLQTSRVIVFYTTTKTREDGSTFNQVFSPSLSGKIEEGYGTPMGHVVFNLHELQNYELIFNRKPLKIEY
jgi:hypothetical protein